MKKLKKILRLLLMALMIGFALAGFGVPASFNKKEEYQDEEIKIEKVDETKEEEGESQEGDHFQ